MRRLSAATAKILIHRLPRLLGQLEANRSTRLLLADAGPVKRITIGRDVTDAQRNEIAASQLAVDREVEERQVAQVPLQVQLGADLSHPYLTRSKPRLRRPLGFPSRRESWTASCGVAVHWCGSAPGCVSSCMPFGWHASASRASSPLRSCCL